MKPLPIAHIGILVADVGTARHHWSNALPESFSPIVRYRAAAWSDLADPTPHANDLRQVVYIGVNPSIDCRTGLRPCSTLRLSSPSKVNGHRQALWNSAYWCPTSRRPSGLGPQ